LCISGRAVYAISDVYLLDDVLSAVDAEVGKHIFEKVVQGLLKNKCLLIVTHQIQYIGNNHVLCLKDGTVEDAGTRAEVEARNPQIFKILEDLGPEVDQKVGDKSLKPLDDSQGKGM